MIPDKQWLKTKSNRSGTQHPFTVSVWPYIRLTAIEVEEVSPQDIIGHDGTINKSENIQVDGKVISVSE